MLRYRLRAGDQHESLEMTEYWHDVRALQMRLKNFDIKFWSFGAGRVKADRRAGLDVGGKVILTPPCILCVETYK
jgi:hypothetical protein